MCPGPTNLGDMTIIRKSEKEQYNLNHKTITLDLIKKIIENNQLFSPKQNIIQVKKTTTHRYNVMPNHADKEKIQEIHEFIKEYRNFSNDDENKYTYMKDIFNKIFVIRKSSISCSISFVTFPDCILCGFLLLSCRPSIPYFRYLFFHL